MYFVSFEFDIWSRVQVMAQNWLELLQLPDHEFPLDEGLLCYNTENNCLVHCTIVGIVIGECHVPCTPFVAAIIDLFIRSYPAFHFCQVAVKSVTCPTFRRFLYKLLVRNDMVVNEHNTVSNIAQKLKYFRYCWACFRLQYAWNICNWTLKQLTINQIDLWRGNGKCSSFIEIKLSPAEFNVRYPIVLHL